jgi:FkbM family methyltransferase
MRRWEKECITVVAFGSRGDVQPLAILTGKLEKLGYITKFVSHASSASLASIYCSDSCYRPIDSLPVLDHEEAHEVDVCTVLAIRDSCVDADLIIFNLFALEGWLIAQHLGKRCMIVHPYIPSSSMPAILRDWFRRTRPALYRSLRTSASNARLEWGDVELWLWPLFGERWQKVIKALGFDDSPIDGCSSLMLRVSLPHAPPVLFAMSSALAGPAAPGWPQGAQVVGPIIHNGEDPTTMIPTPLQVWLEENEGSRPIYVSFGSAGAMCKGIKYVPRLINACLAAVSAQGFRAILHVSSAEDAGNRKSSTNGAFILDDHVSHKWLLPRCALAIHHGGSGTTHAVAAAGLSQIIVPMIADQFFWGEVVQHLGVGLTISQDNWNDPSEASVWPLIGMLAKSIRMCLGAQFAAAARIVASRIGAEDGLHSITSSIAKEMDSPEPSTSTVGEKADLLLGGEDELATIHLPNGMQLHYPRQTTESEICFLYREIFEEKCYSPAPTSGVIVDVGAHVGLFSVWAHLAGDDDGDVRVIAFEPNSKARAALTANLQMFCPDAHEVFPFAIGHKNNTATLRIFPHLSSSSTCVEKLQERRRLQYLQKQRLNPTLSEKLLSQNYDLPCEMLTLSSALQHSRKLSSTDPISLLKVDVEGFEMEVLSGISHADWGRIHQVVVEVSDPVAHAAQVRALISQKGFQVRESCVKFAGGTSPSQTDVTLIHAWRTGNLYFVS